MPMPEYSNRSYRPFAGGFRDRFRRVRSILLAVTALSAAIHAQERIPIVVLDFEGYGISQPESITLTNRLRNELFRFERFQVVERGMMEKILTEQDFQLTGCVSNECLVEIGRLVGAQQAVGGSVGKVGDVYSISARIIDVATGELLQVADYDVTGDLSLVLTEGMAQVAALLAGTEAAMKPKPIEPMESTQPEQVPRSLSRRVAVGLDLSMLYGVIDDDEEGITRIVGISLLGIAIKRYRAPAQPGKFNWYWSYGTDLFIFPYIMLGGDYLFEGRVNAYVGIGITSRIITRIVPRPVVSAGLYF